MMQMETGLRHRLRRALRQMTAQHRHLRALQQALSESVALGRVDEVRASAERLRVAVEAHFSLEDGVFFPAVRGLEPDSARELVTLVREHGDFVAQLARLLDGLAADSLDAFADGYRAFCDSIAEHERREERLVADLTRRFGGLG